MSRQPLGPAPVHPGDLQAVEAYQLVTTAEIIRLNMLNFPVQRG
jgi:hypothetical protein